VCVTARKLRIEYAGAIYHVMNRGDRREAIFLDDKDPKGFIATLRLRHAGELDRRRDRQMP
jgi:hypothetical protein